MFWTFPRKGASKPRGDNISKSKLSFTMAGGALHKSRGHSKMELLFSKTDLRVTCW